MKDGKGAPAVPPERLDYEDCRPEFDRDTGIRVKFPDSFNSLPDYQPEKVEKPGDDA